MLPHEFHVVQALHDLDLRVADVADVRPYLGVDVELVAVDIRMRGDVFVVEGELVVSRSESGDVVGLLAAHRRATARAHLRASVSFNSRKQSFFLTKSNRLLILDKYQRTYTRAGELF